MIFCFSTLEKTNGNLHVLLTQQESMVRALAFDVSVSFYTKPTLLSFQVIHAHNFTAYGRRGSGFCFPPLRSLFIFSFQIILNEK